MHQTDDSLDGLGRVIASEVSDLRCTLGQVVEASALYRRYKAVYVFIKRLMPEPTLH
jgi:hypothetical protein